MPVHKVTALILTASVDKEYNEYTPKGNKMTSADTNRVSLVSRQQTDVNGTQARTIWDKNTPL